MKGYAHKSFWELFLTLIRLWKKVQKFKDLKGQPTAKIDVQVFVILWHFIEMYYFDSLIWLFFL